jgi:hypothetical protein
MFMFKIMMLFSDLFLLCCCADDATELQLAGRLLSYDNNDDVSAAQLVE